MLSSYFSLSFFSFRWQWARFPSFFVVVVGVLAVSCVAFVRLDGRLAQFASALAGCVTVTLVSVGTSDEWWPRMMHSSVTPPRETMVPRHLSFSLSFLSLSRWLESTNTWICCSLYILYHISYFLFLVGHLDALQTAITITASMLYNKHLQCYNSQTAYHMPIAYCLSYIQASFYYLFNSNDSRSPGQSNGYVLYHVEWNNQVLYV